MLLPDQQGSNHTVGINVIDSQLFLTKYLILTGQRLVVRHGNDVTALRASVDNLGHGRIRNSNAASDKCGFLSSSL